MSSPEDPLNTNVLIKLATICRDRELNVIYICCHCDSSFTNNSDTLTHVESHFDTKVNVYDDDFAFGDGQSEISIESGHHTKDENESKLECFNQVMLCESDECEPGDINFECKIQEEISTYPENHEADLKLPITSTQSQCKLCDANFNAPPLLIIHLINDHSSQTTMNCPECSHQDWTNGNTFSEHLQQHIDANETTYNALIDKVISKCRTVAVAVGHCPWTKHQRNSLKTCDICSSTFSNRKKLKSHMINEHIQNHLFDCDECNRKISGKFTFYAHKYAHLIDSDQVNVLSDETLRQNLRKFIDDNIYCDESSLEKTYICRLCSHLPLKVRKSAEMHILQKHIHFHKRKRTRHPCDHCGSTFANRSNLANHKLLHTTVENPFTCQICNRSFPLIRYLRVHERTHSDLKPHQCSICGNTFRTQVRLNFHSRRVHASVPTNCTICNKEIKSHRMKQHIRDVHENEHRPYQCSVCSQAFKTAKTLRTHSYRHSGVKRFECRFHCNEKFISSAARRTHERSKHEAR